MHISGRHPALRTRFPAVAAVGASRVPRPTAAFLDSAKSHPAYRSAAGRIIVERRASFRMRPGVVPLWPSRVEEGPVLSVEHSTLFFAARGPGDILSHRLKSVQNTRCGGE